MPPLRQREQVFGVEEYHHKIMLLLSGGVTRQYRETRIQ